MYVQCHNTSLIRHLVYVLHIINIIKTCALSDSETKTLKAVVPADTVHNINTENAAQDKNKEQEEPSDFSAAGNEDEEDLCLVESLLMHTTNARTQSFLVLFSDGSSRWQEEQYLEIHIV